MSEARRGRPGIKRLYESDNRTSGFFWPQSARELTWAIKKNGADSDQLGRRTKILLRQRADPGDSLDAGRSIYRYLGFRRNLGHQGSREWALLLHAERRHGATSLGVLSPDGPLSEVQAPGRSGCARARTNRRLRCARRSSIRRRYAGAAGIRRATARLRA